MKGIELISPLEYIIETIIFSIEPTEKMKEKLHSPNFIKGIFGLVISVVPIVALIMFVRTIFS